MELKGKVIAIMPLQSGVSPRTGNPWAKQEYVIEVPGQYPRKMCFEVFGDERIKQFNIQMDEEITVSFDVDASEFKGRWYNNIRAWQVTRGGASADSTAGNAADTVAGAPAGNTVGTAAPAAAVQTQDTSLFGEQGPAPAQAAGEANEGGGDGLPF